MGDLRIGAEILKETLDREVGKEERIMRAKQEEKAVAAAHVANVSILMPRPLRPLRSHMLLADQTSFSR